MYESIPKSVILGAPQHYAWNIVVHQHQFTQGQLLAVQKYLDLPTLIRTQRCLTLDFLRTHFATDIHACLEVDWEDVRNAGIQ